MLKVTKNLTAVLVVTTLLGLLCSEKCLASGQDKSVINSLVFRSIRFDLWSQGVNGHGQNSSKEIPAELPTIGQADSSDQVEKMTQPEKASDEIKSQDLGEEGYPEELHRPLSRYSSVEKI